MDSTKKLSDQETNLILQVLKDRFEDHQKRFSKIRWSDIELKLRKNPDKLWTINEMEKTGGEPGLLEYDESLDEYIFCDLSKESPKDRRSLCYDKKALEARKKHKPADSAKNAASKMGVELMDEAAYRKLQSIGEFDTKTSSWLETPEEIRSLGGAIFGDYRYGQVFIYHNGADSYYTVRGFRGVIKL